MRILYLNPIGALGGGERSLLDIFAAIRASEPAWELHLIAGADGALLGEAERLGVRAEVLPMPDELLVLGESAQNAGAGKIGATLRVMQRVSKAGWGARNYAGRLRARVVELAPDVIHSNGMKFHLLTRMMGKARAPIVWHIRDFPGARRIMRHALRWAAPAASLAIANSEAVAADMRAVLPATSVRVVLNCIDTERFSPAPAHGEFLDDLAGIPHAPGGTLRVGLLASYARWKGQDLFLKAASLIAQNAPELNVRFFIVGGPIYKTQGSQFSTEELRALAANLGILDRIGFIPFQNEPQEIYRALDIVVHASTQPEPFGRTIAEAMACGKPVVAALAGGVPELFQDGVEALGAPLSDAPALAKKIDELLRNPATRNSLATAARSAAIQRFSRERLGAQLHAIYGELIQ